LQGSHCRADTLSAPPKAQTSAEMTQHNMPDCSQPDVYLQGCHVRDGKSLLHD